MAMCVHVDGCVSACRCIDVDVRVDAGKCIAVYMHPTLVPLVPTLLPLLPLEPTLVPAHDMPAQMVCWCDARAADTGRHCGTHLCIAPCIFLRMVMPLLMRLAFVDACAPVHLHKSRTKRTS